MKAFCISHRKDVDGLGSAALVTAATGAEVLLSDYDDFIENLRRVPEGIDRFFLCDIGTDNADAGEFLAEIKALTARCVVTYIDHHALSKETLGKLRRAKVKVVHDERECSAVLTYLTLQKELPQAAYLVALYGAVTDYMDDSPIVSKMMEQSDRQQILLESTMLSYALSRRARQEGYPEMIVQELSRMKRPHDIAGVPEAAVEQLREMSALEEVVSANGKKMGRLAYMVTTEYSTGNVAKLLIGAFGVPVGVAMKVKEKGWYEVSTRATSECRAHLGRTLSRVAGKFGGSGGGHRKAAGCRIPADKAEKLIEELARVV